MVKSRDGHKPNHEPEEPANQAGLWFVSRTSSGSLFSQSKMKQQTSPSPVLCFIWQKGMPIHPLPIAPVASLLLLPPPPPPLLPPSSEAVGLASFSRASLLCLPMCPPISWEADTCTETADLSPLLLCQQLAHTAAFSQLAMGFIVLL